MVNTFWREQFYGEARQLCTCRDSAITYNIPNVTRFQGITLEAVRAAHGTVSTNPNFGIGQLVRHFGGESPAGGYNAMRFVNIATESCLSEVRRQRPWFADSHDPSSLRLCFFVRAGLISKIRAVLHIVGDFINSQITIFKSG